MTDFELELTKKLVIFYQASKSEKRKKSLRTILAEVSIENFIRIYLPHHFTIKPDEITQLRERKWIQDEVLNKYVDNIVFNSVNDKIFTIGKLANRNAIKYGCAFPRGFTKTTSVMAYMLWSLALKKQKFILYIGDEHKKTEIHIMNVRHELLFNELLLEDFPHLHPKKQPVKKIDIAFNSGLMLLQEGVLCMSSSGASQRGMNILGQRPTLIICDDLENRKNMNTLDLRNKLKNWFKTEVLSLGGVNDCSIFLIGTIVHFDSILKEVIDGKWAGWQYDSLAAIDNNYDKPLWELFPKERLLQKKMELGSTAFSSEYMNIPFADEDALFREIYIQKNTFDFELMTNLAPERMVCFIDNNHATKRDYCATVLLYKDYDDTYYLLDADLDNTRGEIAKENFIVQFQKRWGFRILGIEKNNQDGFIARLRHRFLLLENIPILIKPVHHSQNKEIRIVSYCQPLIESGRVKFCENYKIQYPKLIQQLLEFPNSKNDDGPDALAGCIEVISKILLDKKSNWENKHKQNISDIIENQKNEGNFDVNKKQILDNIKSTSIDKDKKINNIKNNESSEGNMEFNYIMDIILSGNITWETIKRAEDKPNTIRKRARVGKSYIQYTVKNGNVTITTKDDELNIWQKREQIPPYQIDRIRESIERQDAGLTGRLQEGSNNLEILQELSRLKKQIADFSKKTNENPETEKLNIENTHVIIDNSESDHESESEKINTYTEILKDFEKISSVKQEKPKKSPGRPKKVKK